MLVYLRGTPIWRPENSVNIWNLHWLSRRLIISIEQTSIYVSTFPNALTSKKAQNHDVSIYFSTNSIIDLGRIQNMDRGPWTTPHFLKEIASVNMKIYQRSRYEKHNTDLLLMSLRVCLVIAGCFGVAPP